MILYDFSSVLHRAIFTSVKTMNPHKKDGLFVTDEYIGYTIHRILDEILNTYKEYKKEYGDLVLCLDDHSKSYWRKEFYPNYKGQRKNGRETSEINYDEIFVHINELIDILDKFTPFKSFSVPGAEADDIIAVLTKRFAPTEKILIHSPDKDMVQLHKLGNVRQWSAITNKWVENSEYEDPNYHICLGDASDNIPRIVDEVEFSKNFRDYLDKNGYSSLDELTFYNTFNKAGIIGDYGIYKTNKKGEEIELDIFEKPRFGKSNLEKKIKEFGSLENYLNSNPILKMNYERNKKLILMEGIPAKVETDILVRFNESKTDFHLNEVKEFLSKYNCNSMIAEFNNLFNSFAKKIELTSDNWSF